jgi:hypothetical protein
MRYMALRALLWLVLLFPMALAHAEALSGNLAPLARITASNEYSAEYAARFVADGRIPSEGGQADTGEAWCVNGNLHREEAEIVFAWEEPVTVSEIVYYARTAWFPNETWKDYEVHTGDEAGPVFRGQLEMRHGPQRIALPEAMRTKTLRLRFTSSYGGFNPGASEIQIFETPPPEAALNRFVQMQWLRNIPDIGTDPTALAALIEALALRYGNAYPQAAAHRALLAAAGTDLNDLQREALLFDVDSLLVIARHEINASHVYTYHYEGFQAGGGLYVIPLKDPEGAVLELAASPEGQILDCDLSYDGKTVLFSWRQRENEGYHLWTVNVDGTGLRQLTQGAWHDYNACWLPDGGIAFLSTRAAQFAYCWHAPVGVLYRMEADGGHVVRLSANYLNDFTPYILDDGRIIYSRWEYVDRPAIPIQSLWTIHPDGANLAGYFGNRVLSPGTFMEARQLPGSTQILCTMTGHNGPARGAIGLIDRGHGVNAQAAIVNLTPEVHIPPVDKGDGNTDGAKPYSSPIPLDEMRFLLSARGPVLVRTLKGDCQSVALPPPPGGLQYFCAQPVRPRFRPPVLPSLLDAEMEDAVVFVQDVYNGLEPHVQRGEVKRIRVVREIEKAVRIDPELRAFGFQFPVISCGATYAAKQVLGEVPVEADGSACFRVPANAPVYFMALDEAGRAVQRMRSFTHLMPGETQGCIGCHESRSHASSGPRGEAYGRPPRDLEAPEWGRGGFGFAQIVQPVLDQYCVSCHHPPDPPHGLDFTGDKTDFFSVSYEMLARDPQGQKGSPYVNWIPTYNGQEQNILEVRPKAWGSPKSRLAEIVLHGHPDEHGVPRFQMDDTARRRILAWIDLNVPYYATSETAYPENEGCRRQYPEALDAVLSEVAARRCTPCHESGNVPRREWLRIERPEYNAFLTAPLAREAGGNGRCGAAVFANREDPDYQALLKTFLPIAERLAQTPRMDMPGAEPAPDVCRDRK